MSSLLPLATYNLALQPFSPAPAIEEDYPVTIRLTLAAVDPEAVDEKAEPSTLRLLKRSNRFIDDSEDEDDEDEEDELDDEEEEEEEEAAEEKDGEDSEDEDDLDLDLDDDEEGDVEEFIVCTLSPKVQFQQTIDLTINPEEEVYFVVTGSYPVHLSGNYVEHPADETDSEDEFDEEYDDEEYDMTPDEDELAYDLEDLENASDVENKIEELLEEESKKRSSEEVEAPVAAVSKKAKKAEKKAAAAADKKSVQFTKELEQGPTGSTLVEQPKEAAAAKKETKKEKKERAKKEAAAAVAKEQEESGAPKDKKYPTKTLLGGVVTEDRKIGKGPTAKSGNKVGIRYIGKLKNGKSFDKNTNGKPFTFGLGKGECIKGFDLGVAGMAVGGERRVIIPAKMGYGSQALPGIPANSELTFDIKLVSIK
ncbi:peptidyl-prolyl cis-trans isomerase [[Candida] anglica]|uniref:FK506-binding protein n=1 Tax=[Candida] anglica TaxID=148631 RepID=A0ABP0E907_9ASCO